MTYRWIAVSVCLLLSMAANCVYARVQTQIDRSSIGLNESLNVKFVSDQAVNGDPNFSPLQKDFDIVNTSKSSSTNIINGQITQSYVWSLTLFPKRSGNLTIPSITFDQENSNPVSIRVTENQSDNDGQEPIYIEVEASPKDPYVQAQVLFTVKLFLAVEITNASLSEPEIEASKAIFKKLGTDKEYEAWRNNKRYRVFERRYVIYPQQSGSLSINPIYFNARLVQRSRNFFDPFGSSGRLIRIASDAVSLNVKPIPAQFSGQNWLPSSHLKLSETWAEEPPVFKVGEPITRSITLVAAGLTSAQIPEFKLGQIEQFKYYPDQPYTEDQPGDNGITGLRQEKIAIIPTQAGQYRLPEISIPWWNTRSKQFQVATIPERKITVLPAATRTPAETNPQTEQDTESSASPGGSSSQNAPADPFWQRLSFALMVLWLLTLVLWIISRNPKPATKQTPSDTQASINKSKALLKKACASNDADAAKSALLQWAAANWPDKPPTNLGQIANKVAIALNEQLAILNDQLYAKHKQAWQGQALWHAFESTASQTRKKTSKDHALEPLHKIH